MPPRRSARSTTDKEPPATSSGRKTTRTRVKQEEVEADIPAETSATRKRAASPPVSREKRTTTSRRGQAPAGESSKPARAARTKRAAPKVEAEEEAEEDAGDAPKDDEAVKEPSEDEDEEEFRPAPPKSRAKPGSKKEPAKAKTSKRVIRSDSDGDNIKQEPSHDEHHPETNDDDDDEEDELVKRAKARARSKPPSHGPPRSRGGRGSARGSVKPVHPGATGSDDSGAEKASVKSKSQSVAPTPALSKEEPSDEESEEEDLMAAIRTVPPTPAPGRRGLTVPPSMRRPGLGVVPATPALSDLKLSMEPEIVEPPKSRLVIHKMALVNFKSYAGRQEIGPFHKSFSAIVGPNGSGKSNTIDALLFVFGYRASKMRQGKLSELIHHSANYPDLDHCAVEVHFREIEDLPGPDAYKVVPGSNLVVARTAFKNNSSKYTINDRQSSFTEVTSLLKERGIDFDHKRFLILQGEVESIALMKPKAANEHEDGLLEYLEDIIGTSKYKEDIEKSLVEVDRLNEERAERLNRLRLVERDKAGLEERKKEAEDWLRNKNGLIRAQNTLWQFWTWRHEHNIQKLEETNQTLEAQLHEEREKNADTIAENDELQRSYEERVKAFEVVKKETQPLIKQLSSLEKQEVQLGEKKKHVITKGKKLKKSLGEDRNAKNEAERWIENHGEAIEKGRAELEGLESSLEKEEAELEKIRESLKDKTEVFHAQIEVKQKEIVPWTSKVNKKQAEIDLATNERNMLKEKADALQISVDEAAQTLERLTSEKNGKVSELEELNQELANISRETASTEKKLQTMTEQAERLRSKASSSRQKADEAKASQAASTSQNAVLDNLQRLKAAGRITGFHGRLGDLGTIPDKYDVAVSTACSSLNYLVVDQVKQGEACLSYLKKQNVGRANIYVLEKLPPNIPHVNTPENVPRLYDLINPKDARYAPAFYKALRDTLVADNLEQANRIAFGGQKRWRVVTLTGQLIEASGAMSGGGSRVSKGLMSSKFAASEVVRPEVLRQYESEMEEAEKSLRTFMDEKRTFETEVEELRKRTPRIEMSISKVQLDIQTGERRISEAQKRHRTLQSQNKPDAAELKRIGALESEITSGTKELGKLREKTNAIEADIHDLQNKILEVGGVRLRSQKTKVEGIKEMIDLTNDQVTKAEVGKAKAEKDKEKLEHTVVNNQKTLEDLASELEELDNTLATCTQDIASIREKVEMVREIAEKHQEEMQEMKAELDQKMELINEFRSKELAIKQKVARNTQVLSEERKSVKVLRTNLDKLSLEDVDDEDEDEDENGEEQRSTVQDPKPADAEPSEGDRSVKTDKPVQFELQVYSEEELQDKDENLLKGEVAKLEGLLKEGQPNMKALEEYRRREAEFLKRAKDLESTTEARDVEKKRYDELRKTRLEEFMSGFNTISSKLKEMYQMITLGGNAELELVDSMDPFSEGIIFSVMPPKKSWKNISNLSGGEKTLSSLALVFALHVFKPTPLYFMDEIDAALDFRNVSIIANYIKDRTKNAQFIIISLRNDMFELSHRLIGIYKTSNATRSIAIDNKVLTSGPPKQATAAV